MDKLQKLEQMHKYVVCYSKNVLIFNTNKKIKNKYFDIKYSLLSRGMV